MNTYQFEEVRDQETGTLLWVGAREQQSPWRFFVWVANTGTWHRYQEFEPGAGWVDGVDFREIDAAVVPPLVESVRRIDERRFRWVMDEFRAQPAEEILTHAQLGLDAGRGPRPTRTVALEEIPTDSWMTLKTYGLDGEGKARSLASDIRLGKRKGWPAGVVESRTETNPEGFEVQVRAATEAKDPLAQGAVVESSRETGALTGMVKGNDNDRYVVPNGERGGWDVKKEGSKRVSAHESTQKAAEKRAKEIVENTGRGHGEVRIQAKSGRFIDSDSGSKNEAPAKNTKR